MSALLMGRALYLPLDLPTKMVLIALCDHANHEGEGVWPSLARTATRASVNKRTVQRSLQHLEGHGLIKATGYRRGGHGKTTRWSINADLIRMVSEVVENSFKNSDTESPFSENSDSCDVKQCRWPRETVTHSHPNRQEPSRTLADFLSTAIPRQSGESWDQYLRRLSEAKSAPPATGD